MTKVVYTSQMKNYHKKTPNESRVMQICMPASTRKVHPFASGFPQTYHRIAGRSARILTLPIMEAFCAPVVRCLSILSGLLSMLQQKILIEHQMNVPLSLSSLWAPFADIGLQPDA